MQVEGQARVIWSSTRIDNMRIASNELNSSVDNRQLKITWRDRVRTNTDMVLADFPMPLGVAGYSSIRRMDGICICL